jgi:hypothetical protein
MSDPDNNVDTETFRRLERLRELRIEHRDLDDVIHRLQLDLYVNEVQLRRLKKRKLLLKDQIARMESELIPDLSQCVRPACVGHGCAARDAGTLPVTWPAPSTSGAKHPARALAQTHADIVNIHAGTAE